MVSAGALALQQFLFRHSHTVHSFRIHSQRDPDGKTAIENAGRIVIPGLSAIFDILKMII